MRVLQAEDTELRVEKPRLSCGQRVAHLGLQHSLFSLPLVSQSQELPWWPSAVLEDRLRCSWRSPERGALIKTASVG